MSIKKYSLLVVIAATALTVASCNKEVFLKKLIGTWKLDRYLFDGKDRTIIRDSIYRDYQLNLTSDNNFTEEWKNYAFIPDSTIDTVNVVIDTITGQIVSVETDTIRFVNTVITNRIVGGTWNLINSEEDLQLVDTVNQARMFRILQLDKNSLELRLGNEDFYLGKK